MKKWLSVWKRKWIKGECRHLCLACKYKSLCANDSDIFIFGCWKSRYSKGYCDGYEDGYSDAMQAMEKFTHQ